MLGCPSNRTRLWLCPSGSNNSPSTWPWLKLMARSTQHPVHQRIGRSRLGLRPASLASNLLLIISPYSFRVNRGLRSTSRTLILNSALVQGLRVATLYRATSRHGGAAPSHRRSMPHVESNASNLAQHCASMRTWQSKGAQALGGLSNGRSKKRGFHKLTWHVSCRRIQLRSAAG